VANNQSSFQHLKQMLTGWKTTGRLTSRNAFVWWEKNWKMEGLTSGFVAYCEMACKTGGLQAPAAGHICINNIPPDLKEQRNCRLLRNSDHNF
jgi:hypothetical protein